MRCVWILLVVILLGAASAEALPTFARRYQTTCSTCHVSIPKLNVFGVAFRNNGFRLPQNDAKFVKVPDQELGAPGWKQLWPRAVWPGAMPGALPVALRLTEDAILKPSGPVTLDFRFPSAVALYFAGPLGDTISVLGGIRFSGTTNTFLLTRTYVQFRLMPETPGQNWLTLKVGRIDTRAQPFSSVFRRVTARDFGVNDFRAVPGGFALGDNDAGLELWGAATGPGNRGGLEYAVGVVQGTSGRPEDNNAKDFYGSISLKLGGLGVVGSRNAEGAADADDSSDEYSLTVGAFGYSGGRGSVTGGEPANRFHRVGLKADVWAGRLNVFGAWTKGEDTPRSYASASVTSTAAMVQADYVLLPWIMPMFRVERTASSVGSTETVVVPAVNVLVRSNVRLLGEAQVFTAPPAPGSTTQGNQGTIRLELLF